MYSYLKAGYHRYFHDPQAVLLALLLIAGLATILLSGSLLGPLFVALLFAYLLEGAVIRLQHRGLGRTLAALLVFLAFLATTVLIVLGLLPLLSHQFSQLLEEAPRMIGSGQEALHRLPEKYPALVSEEQIEELLQLLRSGLANLGQGALSFSLASIPAVFTALIYLILVPLLVLFLLKDKEQVVRWCTGFLPEKRSLLRQIWSEMDSQMGNYIRGKFYELAIVGTASYLLFASFSLNYAPLLAALVGLSVIVPYLGAFLVTVPVVLVALFQWGGGADSAWLIALYLVLQCLDGYVLVPLLFSQAVNLHPIAVIAAILFFGGLWGPWGVFFAIPLATLIKILMQAWPRPLEGEDSCGSESEAPPA